jgi:hypothetical protein
MSVDSLPQDIKIYCDDSFVLDTDLQGNGPKDSWVASEGEVIKYDSEWPRPDGTRGKWVEWREGYFCSEMDALSAYTLLDEHVTQDRMVFCLNAFTRANSAPGGATSLGDQIVDGQSRMDMFKNTGGRL